MKNWKTTVGGILAGVGTAFAQFFPEHANYGGFASAVGLVILGIGARDYNVPSEQACPGKLKEATESQKILKP